MLKSISSKELHQKLDTKQQITVVDVRWFKEFDKGHIPHAVCVPLSNFSESDILLRFAGTSLVFYCDTGAMGAEACRFMSEKIGNFKGAYAYLDGGLNAWVADGYKVQNYSHSEDCSSPSFSCNFMSHFTDRSSFCQFIRSLNKEKQICFVFGLFLCVTLFLGKLITGAFYILSFLASAILLYTGLKTNKQYDIVEKILQILLQR